MSEFNDRIRDSVVVSNLKQAEARLRELEERAWEHRSKVDLIARLKVVTANILGRLTVPDCGLVTMTTLNELESPSQRFLNEIESIESFPLNDESDHGHINIAGDDLLRAASTLPALPFRTTPAVIEKAAEQFNREAQSATKVVSEKFSAVQSQLDEVK